MTDDSQTAIPRHRWNTDFTWTDHTGTPSHLTAEQVRQFDEAGYFVLEDVFTADELAPIITELDRIESLTDQFLQLAEDGRVMIAETGAITFSPNPVRNSETLREFTRHAKLLGICADLVGPDVNLYWDQAVYKKPEKPRRFPWHQDNGYTFVEPQQYLTCWIALTDATVENGCPQVAPGLHRLGTLEHTYIEPLGWQIFEEPPEKVAAPVRAGGVVVFSSLTPHLTGPNTTHDVRKAYIVQYAPEGALVLLGEEAEPITHHPMADADIRFPVLRDAQPV
jgi:ectoine hydroxylase-related dioxygenase (phytanoyl-CoA dioxygenase family)